MSYSISKSCLAAFAVAGMALSSSAAVDGVFAASAQDSSESSSTVKYSSASKWNGFAYAKDGGVMTIVNSLGYMNQDISGLVLGGISQECAWNGIHPRFYNNAIRMTGDAFVYDYAKYLKLANNVDFIWSVGCTFAEGLVANEPSATLALLGGGTETFEKPATGFASVSAADGRVVSTSKEGAFATDSSLSASETRLAYIPALASGEKGTNTISSLSAGPGITWLTSDAGSGAEAVLAVSSMSANANSRLAITGSGLGGAAKVKLPSGTTTVGGLLDGRFAVMDKTSSVKGVVAQAAYDAENGVSASPISFVDGKYAFWNPEGAEYPAAFVTGRMDDSVSATFDFGDKPGTVWITSSENNFGKSGYTFSGTAGMTFVNPSDGLTEGNHQAAQIHLYADNVGWTGDTRVMGGVRIWPRNGVTSFPASGDVWFFGGEHPMSAQLWSIGNTTWTQHFHFSGYGPRMTLGDGVFVGNNASSDTFTGITTLEGMSCFRLIAAGGVTFEGAVDGPGGIDYVTGGSGWSTGGFMRFKTANTFAGGMKLADWATLILDGPASTGTGGIAAGASRLNVTNQFAAFETAAAEVPGQVSAASAALSLDNAKVDFGSGATFGTSSLSGIVKTGVGGALDMGEMTEGHGAHVFSATASGASLAFSNSSDREFAFTTEDGSGVLAVEKRGAGVATLSSPWSHTGGTVIRQGTLKLNGDIMDSSNVSWWLDPESGTTVSGGRLESWQSKKGRKLVFSRYYSGGNLAYPEWAASEALQGRNVPVFADAEGQGISNNTALEAKDSAVHAEVFLAYASRKRESPQQSTTYAMIFGRSANDPLGSPNENGVRMANAEKNNPFWQAGTANAAYWGEIGLNGAAPASSGAGLSFTHGQATVMRVRHAGDLYSFNPSSGAVSSSSRSYFRPVIGTYHQFGWGRTYAGAIGEVIAFSRKLAEPERKQVENYLYSKWVAPGGAALFSDADTRVSDLLPASGALEVGLGATLDLNGVDQTVASLSGEGTIANTSSRAVTLTVTGSFDFHGSIVGDVTVRAAGGAVFHKPCGPVREGLNYWLDASAAGTVTTNAAGEVSAWASREGAVASFSKKTNGQTENHAPVYSADGMGEGKPSVNFDMYCGLVGSQACLSRTVFIAGARESGYVATAWDSLFGLNNVDVGLRHPNAKLYTFSDGASYVTMGDTVRYNKAAMTAGNFLLSETPHVIALRLNDCHVERASDGARSFEFYTAVNTLGRYVKNSALYRFGEVISYDRALSDAEMAQVEEYLYDKWVSSAAVPAEPASAFASAAEIVVKAASDGSIEPVVLEGDVDLSNISLSVEGDKAFLAKGARVLGVTGAATGELASATAPGTWLVLRRGSAWVLGKAGLAFLVK